LALATGALAMGFEAIRADGLSDGFARYAVAAPKDRLCARTRHDRRRQRSASRAGDCHSLAGRPRVV